MEKRVTFKNVSTQTNKRARLTHGEGGVVDVGVQTGAVYYEKPEIGMCYSKPMEITATVNEETQCLSLVGLYDLFIDGKRIGRGLSQEEILERVNAGDYGVEVSPCLTVSCENAVGKTNCLTLTGQWDVEINDTRIIDNADEKRILAALKKNALIRAEACAPKCVSSGEYEFKIKPSADKIYTEVMSNIYSPKNSAYLYVEITGSNSEILFDLTLLAREDTEYGFNGLKSVALDKLKLNEELAKFIDISYTHIPNTDNIEVAIRNVTGQSLSVVIQFQTETAGVGGISTTIEPIQQTFPVGSEVVMAIKLTNTDSEESQFYVYRFIFRQEYISVLMDSFDVQLASRAGTDEPWSIDYFLLALANLNILGYTLTKSPEDFEIGSLNYCKDGLVNYESRIFFQNTYALSRETYYYTGGRALNLGTLTIPVIHMKLDDEELTPYTWTPSGQPRTTIERAALEHFKTQLESRGITCQIVDDIHTNTPPAFNGGPVTSTLSLIATATRRFSITTSKQWEGTANHPELNNAQYGWEEKSIGLYANGQDFNSTGYASETGCALGAATAEEVGLSIKLKGISESDPLPNHATFTQMPTSLQFVTLASEGINLKGVQIEFLSVFPELATAEPITSCGYYFIQRIEA